MTDAELQTQYLNCKKLNDAEQWEILAGLYLQRGYTLNAARCIQQAEAARVPDMSAEECAFITEWIV